MPSSEPVDPAVDSQTTPYPVAPTPPTPQAPPTSPVGGTGFPPPSGPPISPSAASYPPPAPPVAPAGYPQMPAALPKTSTNAIIALALSIGSFVICPFILAIAALIVARSASREIKGSNGWVTGDGLVIAARVLAFINIALALLFIATVAVSSILGAQHPASEFPG